MLENLTPNCVKPNCKGETSAIIACECISLEFQKTVIKNGQVLPPYGNTCCLVVKCHGKGQATPTPKVATLSPNFPFLSFVQVAHPF